MKLPEHTHPKCDYGVSMTEPGQAISLKTIAYRVSVGQTTGLSSIPQSFGSDDEYEDADLNGLENDYIDVASQRIDHELMQKELEKARKSTPARPKRKEGHGDASPVAASTLAPQGTGGEA